MTETHKVMHIVQKICSDYGILTPLHAVIEKLAAGEVEISMLLDKKQHFDRSGCVAGGIIHHLSEILLDVTGLSVGSKVRTANFCCNIMKHTTAQKLRAVSKVAHHGRMTMVVECWVYDEQETLLATSLTTMFVIGVHEEIPREW